MTDSERPDPRLPYRSGEDDRKAENLPQRVSRTAILTVLLILGVVAMMLFIAFAIDYPEHGRPAGNSGTMLAYSVIGLFVVILIVTAVKWQNRIERRGDAIGIWIGLGIASLIEGVCLSRLL